MTLPRSRTRATTAPTERASPVRGEPSHSEPEQVTQVVARIRQQGDGIGDEPRRRPRNHEPEIEGDADRECRTEQWT